MTITSDLDVLPVVAPADDVAGPPQGCWTYADWVKLPHDDGNIYEIIDGVLYVFGGPEIPHEAVNAAFVGHLFIHVTLPGLGQVMGSRCGTLLGSKVVVQPDVVVILKENFGIMKRTHIEGAPDLVIEIASPGTAGYDRRTKQDAYAEASVREYWIADPGSRTIEVLALEAGEYRSLGVFRGKATLPSRVLPELPVRVEQFFAQLGPET